MNRYSSGRPSQPSSEVEQADVSRLEANARKMVMRKIEFREHTNAELFTYLISKGVPENIADHLLEQCRSVGLVDDARFARAWVECRSRTGRRSARAVRAELRARGIAADVVEEALLMYTQSRELDAARVFAAGRYRSGEGRDRAKLLRSVRGALGRRGYPFSVCHQVAEETATRLNHGAPR